MEAVCVCVCVCVSVSQVERNCTLYVCMYVCVNQFIEGLCVYESV